MPPPPSTLKKEEIEGKIFFTFIFLFLYFFIQRCFTILNCQGEEMSIKGFNIGNLMPHTKEYITYDGSLTVPGCQVDR